MKPGLIVLIATLAVIASFGGEWWAAYQVVTIARQEQADAREELIALRDAAAALPTYASGVDRRQFDDPQ